VSDPIDGGAVEMAEIRNEFAAVTLAVRPFGRGTRLEVSCPQLGTSAMLDATVLEALTRLSPESLAAIVGVAMRESGERESGERESDERDPDETVSGDGQPR
jgi:hypothetical protein